MPLKPAPSLATLKHQAIAEWLVANPDKTKVECARAFNVTPATIYALTGSDMFQAYVSSLASETFARSFPSLREKVAAVAEASLDKLAEHIGDSQDPSFTLSVADKMLHRLGYAPSKGPTEVYLGPKNNTGTTIVSIPRDVLAAARERVIGQGGGEALAAHPPVGVSVHNASNAPGAERGNAITFDNFIR